MTAIIGKTCPYCQTPIKPGDPALACPSCGMPHHQDCWQENGGCTTFGCTGRPAPPSRLAPPTPGGRPPLSPPHAAGYERPAGAAPPPGRLDLSQRAPWGMISMIAGIISTITCFVWFLAGFFGLAAVVFGVMAKNDPTADQGMATAGLVTGCIGLAFGAISLIVWMGNY